MFKSVAVFLTISFCLASCTQKQSLSSLRDIETYIQERPDSALTMLERIDTSSLKTKSLRAYYSLLYAMALDKNYIDTSDYKIIQPALSYYNGEDDKAMMADYYAGRICSNAGNYSKALAYFCSAFEKTNPEDYKYQGLINYSIGNTYHLSYSCKEELEYHTKALEAFKKLGDERYIDFSIFGLANAYHNNRDFHTADSLYHLICSRGDTLRPLAVSSLLALADNSLKSGEFNDEKVRSLFESAIKNGGKMTLESYYEYAYVLVRLGEKSAADTILQALSAYPDSYTSYWWRYQIEQEKGNHKEAGLLLEASLQLQDNIVRDKINQSVFKSQSEYYKYELLSERREHTILHQRYIIVTVFLLIIISIIFFIFKRRNHLMTQEKEKLLLALGESEKMLQMIRIDSDNKFIEQEKKMFALQKEFVTLYQKQFMEIGQCYDASSSWIPDKVSQKAIKRIASDINDIIAEINSQSGNQSQFEERINKSADSIIAKIRNDYPKYSEDDIRFICYIIVGFDATTISVLMNISGENARVKRYRIRHRLLNDSGPNASLYRAWLE